MNNNRIKSVICCCFLVMIILCGCMNSNQTSNVNGDVKSGIMLLGGGYYRTFLLKNLKSDIEVELGKEEKISLQSDGGINETVKLNNGRIALPESRSGFVHISKDGKLIEKIDIGGDGYASRAFADNEKNLLYVQDAQLGNGQYTKLHVFDQTTYEKVSMIKMKGSMGECDSVSFTDENLYLLITNGRLAGFNDVDQRYLLRISRDTFEQQEIFIKELKYNPNEDDAAIWNVGDVQCYNGKVLVSMYYYDYGKKRKAVRYPL